MSYTYPEKSTRENVVARFLQLSVVIVPQPFLLGVLKCFGAFDRDVILTRGRRCSCFIESFAGKLIDIFHCFSLFYKHFYEKLSKYHTANEKYACR